jgi:deazaflavin-dependent oxidoreductase (nitroreductase family)
LDLGTLESVVRKWLLSSSRYDREAKLSQASIQEQRTWRERPMFKVMLKAMVSVGVFLYRVSGGVIGGRIQTLPVLLLTTTGRKSGKTRTVPVGFLRDGSAYVIIASNAGLPRHPAWFLNLESEPLATIQVKRQQMQVKAETANPEKRRELWARLIEVAPGYANYEKRTSREILVVILHPLDGSGEEQSA